MEFETETIAAAERVMGVRYTEAERRLMQDNLAPQIESARKRRELDFPNDLAPATRFDPRLPGFRAPPPPRPPRWSAPEPGPLPPQDEDIAFAPLTHLAHWIRAGALTSRRLTEIYLSRIETIAPRLECFVTVTAERARAEADAMDARSRAGTPLGPLHGIPYALKDLFDAAGVRTTWGAEPWADRVAERDAAVVERLRAAGAVLLGKATVGALAYGDLWFGGKTRNPWNLNEGASGSSAGSAAATAAGLSAFSIGTDLRLHHLPLATLRHHRTAADLRARLPRRGHGAVLEPRQGRPDLPPGRGHRTGARGDQRGRRPRPRLDRHALQP